MGKKPVILYEVRLPVYQYETFRIFATTSKEAVLKAKQSKAKGVLAPNPTRSRTVRVRSVLEPVNKP